MRAGEPADPNFMLSLARGLEVLRAFERHPSLSVAEAARISGLNRPSASRCPHTLVKLGYARKARSEEPTSELQSIMRTAYDVFCLKKKDHKTELPSQLRITYHNIC